ncbi:phosphatase PAP2 family protein [Candidatus Pacearchaeota archaeon]|nr:phosphatase PAP2 family protein [Candidatus Pacearchaeota archaeon]
MKTKQKIILIYGLFLVFYFILLALDKTLYSLFAIQITESIRNIVFSIQQDLIFFPIVFLFGLACIYFKKGENNKRNKKTIAFIISITISLFIVFILKTFIYKSRPDLLLGFDSFPSGHATILFTLFPFIKENPNLIKISYIIFATLILLSRFLFGYHYLSDLLLGAMIGYSISLLTKFILTKR